MATAAGQAQPAPEEDRHLLGLVDVSTAASSHLGITREAADEQLAAMARRSAALSQVGSVECSEEDWLEIQNAKMREMVKTRGVLPNTFNAASGAAEGIAHIWDDDKMEDDDKELLLAIGMRRKVTIVANMRHAVVRALLTMQGKPGATLCKDLSNETTALVVKEEGQPGKLCTFYASPNPHGVR